MIMVWGRKLFFIMFLWIYLICKIFININEYANKIICLFDQGVKCQCLIFNFGPSFVALDK